LSPDLELFSKFAREGAWNYKIKNTYLTKAVQKAGDIAGCPIPDKVAESYGELEALEYLFDLSKFYTEIQNILKETNPKLAKEWGRQEIRNTKDEPCGSDTSRVPDKIRKANQLRGPGKYREFSIIRLWWIDQQESFFHKKVGLSKLAGLVAISDSLEELQVLTISVMAQRRERHEPLETLTEHISKGIVHEGFFKQNNPYIQVGKTYNLLKEKHSDKRWFPFLEKEIKRVLSLTTTSYS